MILLTGASGRLGQAVGRLLTSRGRTWMVAPRELLVIWPREATVLIECAAGMTEQRMRDRVAMLRDSRVQHYLVASSILVQEWEQGRITPGSKRARGASNRYWAEAYLKKADVCSTIVHLPPLYYGLWLHSRLVMGLRSLYRGRSFWTPQSVDWAAQYLLDKGGLR